MIWFPLNTSGAFLCFRGEGAAGGREGGEERREGGEGAAEGGMKKMIPVPQFGSSIGGFVALIFRDALGQATQSIWGAVCRDECGTLARSYKTSLSVVCAQSTRSRQNGARDMFLFYFYVNHAST